MRLVLKAVPVGRAAAVAVALARVLGLAAAHVAPELLDPRTGRAPGHVSDQASFGRRPVAGGERVEDLYARAGQLALYASARNRSRLRREVA